MDSVEKELLEQHGFDVDGTMKRFLNNEMLYKKCLKKFLDDKSIETLKEACKVGNVEEAFKAAHTMKGFISNLGMEKLHQLLKPMVEKLRVGELLKQEEVKRLEEVYQEMYELVESI